MSIIKNVAKSIIKIRCKEKKKKDFINELSHEMKTPLTIILGYAQILKNEDKYNIDNHFTRAINSIEAEGKKLHTVIEKYIDFSKQ